MYQCLPTIIARVDQIIIIIIIISRHLEENVTTVDRSMVISALNASHRDVVGVILCGPAFVHQDIITTHDVLRRELEGASLAVLDHLQCYHRVASIVSPTHMTSADA